MSDTEKVFTVTGMDCANCAMSIERGVAGMPNVDQCALTYGTAKLRVSGAASEQDVIARVRQLGYDAALDDGTAPAQAPSAQTKTGVMGFFAYLLQRQNTTLALLGLALIIPGLIVGEVLPLFGVTVSSAPVKILSLAALAVAGWPVARGAWRTLRVNHEISINLLMTIAAIGAVAIGAFEEAGLVMVLFALGEALEGYTAERSRNAIRSLMEVAPRQAVVLRECVDCKEHLGQNGYTGGPCPFCGVEEQLVSVDDLRVGERMIVNPGEKIAMDGRLLKGETQVSQAAITGESMPVPKRAGEDVYAGSINGDGAIEVEITRLAKDNTISRIIKMVEEAQEQRAPAQKLVDRFARIYTPLVVVMAALVAFVPPVLFGAPFWNPSANEQGWLYRALELLVVACPCALVISTPVALISAISNAAKNGVLLKGGASLETLSAVSAIAFDKTGTLTEGQPRVVRVHSAQCAGEGHVMGGRAIEIAPVEPAADRPPSRTMGVGAGRRSAESPQGAISIANSVSDICPACDDLLAMASALERRSSHPLARAVLDAARERQLDSAYAPAEAVVAMSGKGLTGVVAGRRALIGSHAYFEANLPHDAQVCAEVNDFSAQGETPLMVGVDNRFAGYISVADAPRESSVQALAALKRDGVARLVMLTGDNAGAAKNIAQKLGLDEFRAELLPEHKLDVIHALKQNGKVAMIGDGVNDAPALAAADVGIAMGRGGTAQAIETADVVLMQDDLSKLPFALRLARATLRTIKFNVAVSIGIKIVFFGLALAGLGSMWMAVLADMGVSLLVTLNGMRLLRFKGD